MAQNLVAPAKSGSKKNRRVGFALRKSKFANQRREKAGIIPLEALKVEVAKLYGRGLGRAQIAKAMAHQISPFAAPYRREKQARNILRVWEQHPEFRDLIYAHATTVLDLDAPKILQGISRAAQRGRVDAARLALEVTGRHTSQEAVVTNVTVQIAEIPRPQRNVIQGEVVDED